MANITCIDNFNISNSINIPFIIDRILPTISLSDSDQIINTNTATITLTIDTIHGATVGQNLNNPVSLYYKNTSSYQYKVNGISCPYNVRKLILTTNNKVIIIPLSDLNSVNNQQKQNTGKIDIVDLYGNVSYEKDVVITVDKIKPTITFSGTDINASYVYNSYINFTMTSNKACTVVIDDGYTNVTNTELALLTIIIYHKAYQII